MQLFVVRGAEPCKQTDAGQQVAPCHVAQHLLCLCIEQAFPQGRIHCQCLVYYQFLVNQL